MHREVTGAGREYALGGGNGVGSSHYQRHQPQYRSSPPAGDLLTSREREEGAGGGFRGSAYRDQVLNHNHHSHSTSAPVIPTHHHHHQPYGPPHPSQQRPASATSPAPSNISTATATSDLSSNPHGLGNLPTIKADGLGPKIWTGTHFLPRFVRAAEVPGEGMCYFYDDGSHCKTVIDGEAVNAHWGVTKAGKPRKRLAIACVTCREKKIKCDPDYPRCVQCEKFGRICKFKNA